MCCAVLSRSVMSDSCDPTGCSCQAPSVSFAVTLLGCLPGEPHGQRSLVGYSSRGRKESDMTERLHFHFSLSCIGEGNGNPLQCSCLENPRDRGAWWAAVYGVAQSRTRLKLLSSSSSSASWEALYAQRDPLFEFRISSFSVLLRLLLCM